MNSKSNFVRLVSIVKSCKSEVEVQTTNQRIVGGLFDKIFWALCKHGQTILNQGWLEFTVLTTCELIVNLHCYKDWLSESELCRNISSSHWNSFKCGISQNRTSCIIFMTTLFWPSSNGSFQPLKSGHLSKSGHYWSQKCPHLGGSSKQCIFTV